MEENGARYTEVPDGLSTAWETFIIGIDGSRLYGREFIECLSDGNEERCDRTLTLSFHMSNATGFLAGFVELPYQYPIPTLDGGANHLARTTRPTNQLVVISASQLGQVAGAFNNHGALTYLLATTLMNGRDAGLTQSQITVKLLKSRRGTR
ncbi:hypothetical protein FS837_004781 [Tulasnella sp. UAMH 9824]|nr:hypothetical protein FS837_004781 [Tulasnella sp. UAMH 9824]